MKKLLSFILALAMLSAANIMPVSAAEYKYADFLKNDIAKIEELLRKCEQEGITPEYEQATYNILNWYISNDFMLKDEMKKNDCEANKKLCGKNCTEEKCELEDILEYNKNILTKMCNETAENLSEYLAGTKEPMNTGNQYDMSNVYVSEDGILRDKNENPLFSVGYSSNLSTSWDLSSIASYGAENAVIEIGPSMVYTKNIAKDWVSQRSGSNVAYSKELVNGSNAVKVTSSSDSGSFSIKQTVSVEPGSNYTLSFKVKGRNVGLTKINIYNSDTAGWIAGKDIAANTLSSVWEVKSIKFTPTVNAVDVEFTLNGKADELYIGNVQLIKSGTAVNLISNPGFEEDAQTNMNKYWFRSFLNKLRQAKDGNVSVTLLVSPHYFPTLEGYENDTDLYAKNSDGTWKTGEFIKYNINHPKAKEIIGDFLITLAQLIKDNECESAVGNIVLTNESAFNVRNFKDFYIDDFRSYLIDKYGSISSLNAKWATYFGSFDEITYIRNWCEIDSPGDYDTITYNENVFTDWHSWMTGILKEYLPNVLINAKPMSYIDMESNPYWKIGKGVDIEKFNTFSALAGCDAYSFDSYSEPISRDSFMFKMMWYDFLHTLTGKPVNNSEDHIIAEGDAEYSERMRRNVYADLWQGALHGRAISSVWNFSTHDYNNIYDSDSTNNYLITTRPDCMEVVAHVGLDLKRNSELLEEMNKTNPNIALFYSKSSQMHVNTDGSGVNNGQNPGTEYLRQLFAAYQGIVYAGEKVGFVSEDNPDKVYSYKVLIVPSAEHITDDALSVLQDYIDNGGQVILVNDCFMYDECHNSRNNKLSNTIAVTASTADDYKKIVNSLKSEDGVRMIDVQTGEDAENIEWSYIKKGDTLYLNIMNYNDSDKQLNIYCGGKTASVGKELISGQITDDTVTAENFVPALLKMELKELPESKLYGFSVNNQGKISWNSNRGIYYDGAEIFKVMPNGLLKLYETELTSFDGASGATYEIRSMNSENGVRITLGDENTFSVSSEQKGSIVVLNNLNTPAHGIVVMEAKDAQGNAKKISCVEFTAGKGESRKIGFSVDDEYDVEIKVIDNNDCENVLSNVISYIIE